MTPPPASSATAARQVAPAPRRTEQPRPSLRPVDAPPRRRRRRRPGRLVAPALLVGSLLAVVVGHTLLAQGQVRLSSLTTQLSNEQVRHRADILALTQLETPSRVVVEAEKKLGMVTPAQIVQLPSVPLDRPLPAPTLAPAPAPPTTSPVAATATGSSSGAASGGATVTSTTAAGGSPPASGR